MLSCLWVDREEAMHSPSQQESATAAEIAFRAGFIQGADAVINGMRGRLFPMDLIKIRAWMKALLQWKIPSAQDRAKPPQFPVLGPPANPDLRP